MDAVVLGRMSTPAVRAAGLLRAAFATLGRPLAFGLWDGSTVHVGGEPAPFRVVFRSRRAFRRLLLRPTPLRFAEAYVAGGVDLEGDLFAAMHAGQALEGLRVPWAVRLRALVEILRP